MQVLGDLIRLPDSEEKGLPLPWWHRAPLGLSNNTNVFAALTIASEGRPVSDLIVTVLNPSRWTRMFRLDCEREDAPGVVADAFKKIPPLNIALAETVKLETGNLHRVSLICEPTSAEQNTQKEIERIRAELEGELFSVKTEPMPSLPDLAWISSGYVEHGWVKGVQWHQEIAARYSPAVKKVDLKKVVVSADTKSRVLRFVFPRRGVMAVSIKHADEPGALAEITSTLRSCDLNILSAFLRRGGGRGVNAELVAVCEPINDVSDDGISRLKERIKEGITNIQPGIRPKLNISEGKYAEDTIYSRHPEEIAARVPRNISGAVHEFKDRLKGMAGNEKAIPIFLSRRFQESSHDSRIIEDVRQALRDNNCLPVEAEPTIARDPITIYTEVSSKMWASKAGIVLVVKADDKRHISLNLAEELGFLLGQGKMVLMLVESEQECIEMMNSFANLAGVLFHPIHPNLAQDNPNSLQSIIREWVKRVRNDLNRP